MLHIDSDMLSKATDILKKLYLVAYNWIGSNNNLNLNLVVPVFLTLLYGPI